MIEDDTTLDLLADLGEPEPAPASLRESLQAAVDEHAGKAEAAQAPAEEAVPAAPASSPLEAPKHWSNEDRDLFTKQPREAQEWLLARHKAMEGDNTRVSQELAEARKWREPIEQVLAPYADLLKQHNLSPANVLQNYINAERMLTENPIQGLLELAKRYKVEPAALMAAAYGEQQAPTGNQIDPTLMALIQPLQNELAQVKGALSAREKAEADAEAKAISTQITEFAQSRDANNALLYPHIENPQVRDMMSVLIATGKVDIAKAGGVLPALKQAYEQAVYAIPETRSALVKSLVESQTKEAADKQRQQVARAKKAGVQVSGSSATNSAPKPNGSVRALLEAAAQEQNFV